MTQLVIGQTVHLAIVIRENQINKGEYMFLRHSGQVISYDEQTVCLTHKASPPRPPKTAKHQLSSDYAEPSSVVEFRKRSEVYTTPQEAEQAAIKKYNQS